jgi:uncharacterized protein (TIGR02172 family)
MAHKDLERPIASGRTAEIYAWKDGYILKLFREWMPADAAKYEAQIARTVYETGSRVPAVDDVVTHKGRTGIVYERVEGRSMMSAFGSQLWRLGHFARLLAELHAEMHTHRAPALPSQKQRLIVKIEETTLLPEDLKTRALDALTDMPEDDRLCHGDFHPDNVLLTSDGPIIIDWVDATRGSPTADVARTSFLLSRGSLPPETPKPIRWLISRVRRQFHRLYLKRYLALSPVNDQALSLWRPLVAAARSNENIEGEKALLISQIKAGLLSDPNTKH